MGAGHALAAHALRLVWSLGCMPTTRATLQQLYSSGHRALGVCVEKDFYQHFPQPQAWGLAAVNYTRMLACLRPLLAKVDEGCPQWCVQGVRGSCNSNMPTTNFQRVEVSTTTGGPAGGGGGIESQRWYVRGSNRSATSFLRAEEGLLPFFQGWRKCDRNCLLEG